MIRQFVFGPDNGNRLQLSETGQVNTFRVEVGSEDGLSIVYLTKEDAREIAKILGTSYSTYGESIRFQPDPESLVEKDLSDIDV